MSGVVSVSVKSYVPRVTAAVHAKAALATAKAAHDIEAQMKIRAPVDTGNLRNSINTQGAGVNWIVHSPAEYSIYQEFGTYKMPAHPFCVPASEAVRPSYIAALKA